MPKSGAERADAEEMRNVDVVISARSVEMFNLKGSIMIEEIKCSLRWREQAGADASRGQG